MPPKEVVGFTRVFHSEVDQLLMKPIVFKKGLMLLPTRRLETREEKCQPLVTRAL